MNELTKIAVVDDHLIVAEGFKQFIELSGTYEVVRLFDCPNKALSELSNMSIDVIIVDIALKDASGIELMDTLTQYYPSLKIIALSMYDREPYISEALKAGASAYVSKRAASNQILKALSTVLKGDIYISDDVKANYEHVKQTGGDTDLTEREIEVLRLLAQGFETKEVAYKLDMAEKTAHSHKAKIYLKLGVRTRKKMLQYALLKNYISVDDILQD